jgi:excisionase family DNA binding protein
MDNKVDIVRQNLLLLIDEWMQQLNTKVDENQGMNSNHEAEGIKEVKTADAVLSVRELATLLGVSTDSIYTMVREHQIPFFRVRRRILFYRLAIEKWIERNER